MISIESRSQRYRAVLTEAPGAVRVVVFDRGLGATRGYGREVGRTEMPGARMPDAQEAVAGWLLDYGREDR